jgi:peptidoglycan/xylan/chitin deacetylase (PgdA/CDA1 family)
VDPRIVEQRRRRRLAERRRVVARRRRNALLGAATLAFVLGIVIGAGYEDPPKAKGDEPRRTVTIAAAPIADDVPTVTDFRGAVPILMYHAIAPAPPGAALPNLWVPQAEFEEQMKWLDGEGYHAVTMGQLVSAWEGGEPIPRKPVVVSFDDGLQSQYVGAKPMLDRLGWPGVLNLTIDHVDSGEITDEQVTQLLDSGWELGSHTFTHRDLTELDSTELEREIAGARSELIQRFATAVDFFCYPAGDYNARVLRAVRDAGYAGATTTHEGLATPDQNPFELSRIRVEPGMGAGGLEASLRQQ